MSLNVGIYVFDDVEVLDFAGPYEVFTTASRVHALNRAPASPLFNVFTVGRTGAQVRARAGLVVQPDHDFREHPIIDVLIVPGGVVTKELADSEVIKWIAATTETTTITASVCTGAFLLGKAGLLTGRDATTHWEDIEDMRSTFPSVNVLAEKRWIDAGKVVTSAGISAGIDMCLHLVERIYGRELARKTARQMEYDWAENA